VAGPALPLLLHAHRRAPDVPLVVVPLRRQVRAAHLVHLERGGVAGLVVILLVRVGVVVAAAHPRVARFLLIGVSAVGGVLSDGNRIRRCPSLHLVHPVRVHRAVVAVQPIDSANSRAVEVVPRRPVAANVSHVGLPVHIA